jgi:hypothetical protein
MMLTYTKSEELMLAKEAAYMEKLQEIPDLNVSALAAMAALYRAGWRECWMEVAKAHFDVSEDEPTAHKEEGTDDVR